MSATLPYGMSTRTLFPDPNELLTGKVLNKKASDIEERWARASVGTNWEILAFRVRIDPTGTYLENTWTNVPGEVEIDFLMTNFTIVQPVSLKGEIAHFYTDWQAQVDALKEAAIDKYGRSQGWLPILSVPSRRQDLYRLSNQFQANALLREVLP